jgi:hypothetical protein
MEISQLLKRLDLALELKLTFGRKMVFEEKNSGKTFGNV